MTDKEVLSDTYKLKYMRDMYARPIDISQLKLMSGDTLLERSDQFLGLYGVGVYGQL